MSRSAGVEDVPTLKGALLEKTVEQLKELCRLTEEKKHLPTRISDLVDVVLRHLKGDRLRTV